MIPVGYLAKRIPKQRPDWLHAPEVADIYSVSDCVNETLATYAPGWSHNGFWTFDSPEAIKSAIPQDGEIADAMLFFYEAYESAFDNEKWFAVSPDAAFETNVLIPINKSLEGFDVVAFGDGPNSHSPLSCNSVAADVKTNKHCLFETFEEAVFALEHGVFEQCEPGPYRIYAVWSVPWPENDSSHVATT